MKMRPRIHHIASGAFNGAAIDVDQIDTFKAVGVQGVVRQEAKSAAEVRASAAEFWEPPKQKELPGVNTVPAEYAGLRPEADAFQQTRRAIAYRLFDASERLRPAGAADAMMALAAFFDCTAKRLQFRAQAGPAFILWRQRRQRPARGDRDQPLCNGMTPFERAGRSLH